jgi:hypothetical protein
LHYGDEEYYASTALETYANAKIACNSMGARIANIHHSTMPNIGDILRALSITAQRGNPIYYGKLVNILDNKYFIAT